MHFYFKALGVCLVFQARPFLCWIGILMHLHNVCKDTHMHPRTRTHTYTR